jgi:hypothetical protein
MKFMTLLHLPKILEAFDFVDPYVQAVLPQSVILLPTEKFRAIEHEYAQLVELSATSPDEGVRRKAAEFGHYPKLTIDRDIADFDFSGVAGQEQAVLHEIEGQQPDPLFAPRGRQTAQSVAAPAKAPAAAAGGAATAPGPADESLNRGSEAGSAKDKARGPDA